MLNALRKLKKSLFLKELFYPLIFILNKNQKNITGESNSFQIDRQALLRNVIVKVNGNGNSIVIRRGVKLLNTKIEIHGDNCQCIIEDDCRIQGSYLWMEDNDGLLKIGRATTFEKEVKICVTEEKSKIIIGEDCMFAYGVVIRSGDSHSIIDLELDQRINYAEDININNHVWIGTNSQILKGSNIGMNSIVAAGAIVTKNIPENCIAAGVPANVKKKKVTWAREKITKKVN